MSREQGATKLFRPIPAAPVHTDESLYDGQRPGPLTLPWAHTPHPRDGELGDPQTADLQWYLARKATEVQYLLNWLYRTLLYSASGATLLSFALAFFLAPTIFSRTSNESHEAHWPGWANIEYVITFGDSYTTTGFDSSGVQPSFSNPLGNPVYPGQTSSNGPNWVDFLTTVHNQSVVRTANLAYGGATLDPDLKSANLPGTLSLREQINDEYLPIYSSHPSTFDWKAGTTLFAIWIGINDVHDSDPYDYQTLDIIFNMYQGLVEKLYGSGARNFLFINVPPLERAPNVVRGGPQEQRVHQANVDLWNKNLTMLADNLRESHVGVTTFLFDANKLFNEVIETPCSYVESCPYQNTTWYCDYYIFGTPDWYTKFPECPYPVDEFFWLNDLHPTFRVHNVTAQEVAKFLT
nr:acetylesterase [Quercus suber]